MSAPVEVRNLTKRFGPTVAVDDLSFTVDAGRIVGFLGPNGAGKTTTLRVLLGLIGPTEGTALVEGKLYRQLGDPLGTVGAVLDGGSQHPGRTGRNHLVALARTAGMAPGRVDELLELVELSDVGAKRAGKYSLGMHQRLGLATALLGDPRILVLDEPANGLDPQGVRWLRDFLRRLAGEGRTILVSSHVLAEMAQTVDEVVVIHRGRSVAQSSLQELMLSRGGGVRVVAPDTERLRGLLNDQGATVTTAPDGSLLVADRTLEEVGRTIAESGVVISELSQVSQSLEDVFFELTDGTEGAS